MTARIEFHRTTRPQDFQTVEEPVNVVAALEKLGKSADLVVLDCLTLWVSNLMQRHEWTTGPFSRRRISSRRRCSTRPSRASS